MKCIPYRSRVFKNSYQLIRWYYEDQLHSFNDQPSSIYDGGDKFWYTENRLNRGDGKPAMVCSDGFKKWCINGRTIKEQYSDGSIKIYGRS